MPVPEFMVSLKSLAYLDLSDMNFSGRVPPKLGNLTKLVYLDIHNDFIYGYAYRFAHAYAYTYAYSTDVSWLSSLHSLEHLHSLVIVNILDQKGRIEEEVRSKKNKHAT